MFPVPVTPPGTASGTGATTGATQPFVGSNTSIGSLVAGLNNANVFSSIGRVLVDGMGNVYASPTVGLMSNIMVGTYNVNSDCSVTMTLYDPFPAEATIGTGGTGTTTGTGTGTSTVTAGLQSGKVTLQGLIVSNAQELDLVATNSNAAGATVKLSKTAQFSSCTNATLSGNYTISGTGVYLASAGNGILNPGTGPGNGGTTTGGTTQTSPLTAGFSGTYTVNADCTGNGRLTDQNGVTRNIGFVLVNTAAQCSVGAIPQTSARQELDFGSGTAAQQ